jgi:hypothetical protein
LPSLEPLSPGDVYTMATYSQAVNVFGAVKTSKLGAVMDPIGQVASGCVHGWVIVCANKYVIQGVSVDWFLV